MSQLDVEARERIRELSALYMRGLDRLDDALLRGVFHDDASVDYGFFRGAAAEFVEFACNALRSHASNHHLIGQILIWPDSAVSARGEVYFQAYHRIDGADGPVDVLISGRYLDRYEQRADGWKILYRSEVVDWTRTEPGADDYLRRRPDALRGARAPDDVSYLL
ncbi:MAG: nuclear transport factor 2 family protein [Pseudomonadales bacterium]